jgi:ribosomal-protein-alanine N-acetyltransferase
MLQRDMPRVLQIERDSFETPWTKTDFGKMLRRRDCIGIVAEHGGVLVSFAVYLLAGHVELYNLAVVHEYRGLGVGKAVVEKLKTKLGRRPRSRRAIGLNVCEYNLNAQQFFRSQGFRAVAVLRDWHATGTTDAYRMVYRVGYKPEWNNRISRHLPLIT